MKKLDFSNYTFRASKVGTLLTKGFLESKTVQSWLIDIYIEERYKLKNEIISKYLDSGKAREDDSIKLLSKIDSREYKKNTSERRYNEFVEGDCDILCMDKIIDIKSSWDIYTFLPHILEDDIKNRLYEYQGIAYCELYGVDKFELCYCLVDMPNELLQDEYRRLLYKFGKDKEHSMEYIHACIDLRNKFNVTSKMSLNSRVIRFEFDYDDEKKAKYVELCEKIKEARIWLNNFAEKELERSKKLELI